MLKGPELFSPFRYFERLKKRQRVVLKRMQYLGMLTAEEVDDAYNEELVIVRRKNIVIKLVLLVMLLINWLKCMVRSIIRLA